MATRLYDLLSQKGNHEIGSLNTKWTVHMTNGAIADENIENYTLVEIYYNNEGELRCKQLTDTKKKGYLVTTVEEDQLMEGEEYVDFYNGKNEIIRITDVKVQLNSRFETSAFSKNADVTEVKRGYVAHFDPTTKKYIISNPASAHADYADAVNKFEVVDEDSMFGYAFDKPTIRLMSI
ncbi:hypothetical protein ACR77J_08055 [Tissierella praeacuta]|uniref:hypothetical protein n=1 Tax=Tissierella praeacuta TaxID=43131 RepID=UPI003DA606A4